MMPVLIKMENRLIRENMEAELTRLGGGPFYLYTYMNDARENVQKLKHVEMCS